MNEGTGGDWVARAREARDRCDEPGANPGYEELKRLRAGNAELRTGVVVPPSGTIRGRVGQGGDERWAWHAPVDDQRTKHAGATYAGLCIAGGQPVLSCPHVGWYPGSAARTPKPGCSPGPGPAPPGVQAVAAALCEGAPGRTGLPVGWSRTCGSWAGPFTTRAVADSMRRQGLVARQTRRRCSGRPRGSSFRSSCAGARGCRTRGTGPTRPPVSGWWR